MTLGGAVASTAGDDDPPPIPTLLRDAPELQLAWGLQLGDAASITRVDLLGAMGPVGPDPCSASGDYDAVPFGASARVEGHLNS